MNQLRPPAHKLVIIEFPGCITIKSNQLAKPCITGQRATIASESRRLQFYVSEVSVSGGSYVRICRPGVIVLDSHSGESIEICMGALPIQVPFGCLWPLHLSHYRVYSFCRSLAIVFSCTLLVPS